MSKDTTAAAPRPVIVIDTNVWLDLLVFDDPGTRALGQALDAGQFDVVMSDRCEAEWQVIINQPRWNQRQVDRDRLLPHLGETTRRIAATEALPPGSMPRCRDPHDQKFVELAVRSGAAWLISKDRDLLKLRRAMARLGCSVVTPNAFPLLPVHP